MIGQTLLVGLVVLMAPAVYADVVVPEEWIGIWELEVAIYDCDTNALLFSSTQLDTICPGFAFTDPDPDSIDFDCTGSANATTYTNHCEGSEEISPTCTMNFVYDVTGTRTGNSYTSVGVSTITYTGDCPFVMDSCQRTEISGTRIATDPGPCESTPTENRPWATVKSYYR
jgi:hypothetical protein